MSIPHPGIAHKQSLGRILVELGVNDRNSTIAAAYARVGCTLKGIDDRFGLRYSPGR